MGDIEDFFLKEDEVDTYARSYGENTARFFADATAGLSAPCSVPQGQVSAANNGVVGLPDWLKWLEGPDSQVDEGTPGVFPPDSPYQPGPPTYSATPQDYTPNPSMASLVGLPRSSNPSNSPVSGIDFLESPSHSSQYEHAKSDEISRNISHDWQSQASVPSNNDPGISVFSSPVPPLSTTSLKRKSRSITGSDSQERSTIRNFPSSRRIPSGPSHLGDYANHNGAPGLTDYKRPTGTSMGTKLRNGLASGIPESRLSDASERPQEPNTTFSFYSNQLAERVRLESPQDFFNVLHSEPSYQSYTPYTASMGRSSYEGILARNHPDRREVIDLTGDDNDSENITKSSILPQQSIDPFPEFDRYRIRNQPEVGAAQGGVITGGYELAHILRGDGNPDHTPSYWSGNNSNVHSAHGGVVTGGYELASILRGDNNMPFSSVGDCSSQRTVPILTEAVRPNQSYLLPSPIAAGSVGRIQPSLVDDARQSSSRTEAGPNREISALLSSIQDDTIPPPGNREKTPAHMSSQLLEHQKIALGWLKRQEMSHYRGGILADDMGLGKTVSAIALILARPSPDPIRKTTLIVAPLSLMRQWEHELKRHVRQDHRLKVFIYHGKIKTIGYDQLRKFDVVLTTYQTLSSEKSRGSVSATLLPPSTWYRVILDEAHNIKNRKARVFEAVQALRAEFRLCLTGTPIMNSIDELFPYLSFLRIPPLNDYRRFNREISKPLKQKGGRSDHIGPVQRVLKSIMLRRQKSTIIDGNPICVIPPKHVHLHNVALSTAEKEFYRNIEAKGQALINRYLGPDRTDAPHAAVLAHILRLRQACCHAYLVTLLGQQEPVQGVSDEDLKRCAQHFGRDVVERLRQGFEAECPICFDIASNPTIFFPCGHSSCSECCQKLFETSASANCPQCRRILNHKAITDYKSFCFVHFPGQWADGFPTESSDHESETLAEARRASRRNKDCKTKYLRRLGEDFQSSTKIDMAMSLLAKIRTDDPTEKTIIFSQFTALLDLVEVSLRGEGYKYQRYDGTMKMDERAEAVEDFMDRSEVNIILVSLRAGNAGLNLNKASQVILLDPFWNPFLEDQAVDRAHRMHQAREVHVHRLLVPETVEDRILQLQADKRELVEIAMNEGKLGRAGAGLSREEVRYLVTGQRGN